MTTSRTLRKRRRSLVREFGRCAYCGTDFRRGNFGRATLDHVVPRVQGGSDDYANLAPCCGACNQSKGGLRPEEWAESILLNLARYQLAMLMPAATEGGAAC